MIGHHSGADEQTITIAIPEGSRGQVVNEIARELRARAKDRGHDLSKVRGMNVSDVRFIAKGDRTVTYAVGRRVGRDET